MTTTDPATSGGSGGVTQRFLDGIERVGNKVPHPAIIFLGLCGLVIVLSQVLYWLDVSVTYDVVEATDPTVVEEEYLGGSTEPGYYPSYDYEDEEYEVREQTTRIEGLLSVDGVRFILSSFVSNFAGFSVVAVVFVAMIGVGVAEGGGLMGAVIRKLVAVSPPKALTFIIVLVGIVSSIATDAGYLILIPLGGAAFLSVGRHPLAGIAAAFAGVSAAFAVNLLITPTDGLITEITNEALQLVDPDSSLDLTANLWFSIGSTFFLAVVISFVTERMIEPRLGTYHPPEDDGDHPADEEAAPAGDEQRGLRHSLYWTLGAIAAITLLTVLPDAPLRHPETGAIIGDSPFMSSLIFLITLVLIAAGIGYGRGAGTYTSSVDVINAITKAFAGLAGLIFLLLLISQFIAYFNYSNMPTVAAVALADLLEQADIGAIWLLVGLIAVTALLNIIIPGVAPKWAIFAPVFVPLFMRLDVAPQTVLAAYRIGDAPTNVITPLMVYLPLIVLTAQRYRRDAGVGTIVSLMIPYTLVVFVAWTVFFVIWFLLGIPLGPGYSVGV